MSEHFTYLSPFIEGADTQKFVTAIAVASALAFFGAQAAAKIKNSEGLNKAVVPSRKLGLVGIFDIFTESFVSYADSVMGKERRKHVPFCAAIFLLVLFLNLIGLIPGMPAPTTTVWINVGVALVVFIYFNACGIKENGIGGYFSHFLSGLGIAGLPIAILEIVSMCLRVATLNLRLYWNVSADHIVLEVFTGLTKVLSFPFYALGSFVAFMQAFVFTTLTMIYILLATQHEEGHH